MNIEQYEYVGGPHTTAGVKLLLHEKTRKPLVGDLGFNVPPGEQALVGVSVTKVYVMSVRLRFYVNFNMLPFSLFKDSAFANENV